MIAALMAFIGVIPGLSTAVSFVMGKMFDAKVQMMQARIGGDVTVAVATVKAAQLAEATRVDGLKVISGSWVLSFLIIGFAVPWIAYEWKVVIWDNVLQWGTTPAIKGDVATWATTIITCLFGSGTVLTAGHMYFNRSKTGE